jgi:anti-anti-sigma regulatory factor
MQQEIGRLTAMLQQYEADMRLINQVSQTLGVGFARLEELYETIYDLIATALPVDAFYIVLATPGSSVGHFPLLCDNGVRYPPESRTLGPLLRWILERGEPLLFGDVYAEASKRFGHDPIHYGQETRDARSWLGVPMRVRGEIKGVMSVQSYEPALYGGRERRLLNVIASQSAVAIENARLFQQVQQTVAELSTPIVPVYDEVLVLPLIGAVDPQRAERILETLLAGIEEHGAQVVIMDITGVPKVDASVAHSLLQAARAARLLGAQTVLTGLRPQVAETIVTLGVDLAELATRSNLQAGIEYARELIERKS